VTYTATDAAGNVGTATQKVVVSYVSTVGGGGGTVITQPPAPGGGATVTAEAVYWHHNDHLGTPPALTDASGRVVWTMSQTPFGVATVNEDPDGDGIKVTNNFRFPGQYFDAETGLNYNYFRTYDPILGRYTQSDPIGLNGGMNTFGYVGGNPLSVFDSTGLTTISLGVGGAFQQTAAGASQSYSLGVSTSGKFCFITTTCARVGPGESAGAGVVASVSKGDFCPGNTATLGAFAEGGDALLTGGSVDVGSSGDVSGSVGFKGFIGGGAAAGSQLCVTHTSCW